MKTILHGTKFYGTSAWVMWWLYPAMSNEQTQNTIKDLGLTYIHQPSCNGFLCDGEFKTTRGYTLIKQYGEINA